MRAMRDFEDIVPIDRLRTQAARILHRLRGSRRAVVITRNGRPAGVLVSPREFHRLCEQRRFLEGVRQGLADADAGRLIEDSEIERDLDKRYGRR